MTLSLKSKEIIIKVVCYLYILLFVYAAVSKLLDYENFEIQVGQSPLLSIFAKFISVSVLVLEIFISIILSIPRLRGIGLYLAFNLMVMFTTYITLILNYSSYVPCSCGGILEDLSWREHLWFNIMFCLLAGYAILLMPNISSNHSINSKKQILI